MPSCPINSFPYTRAIPSDAARPPREQFVLRPVRVLEFVSGPEVELVRTAPVEIARELEIDRLRNLYARLRECLPQKGLGL